MDLHHALQREKKAMPAPLSGVAENGLFEGYACLFGKEDLGRDIIRPGAFAKSLTRRGTDGVKLLYQHDPAQPVGQWLSINEDGKGLFVRGQLALEVARAREILSMMKAGILDGLSIGFRTILGHTDQQSGIRQLVELDLWEISIVTFPMQPDARISSVKTCLDAATVANRQAPPISKRILERKLMQDAGLSRSQARALLAQGYPGLLGKQDAATMGALNPSIRLRQMTDCLQLATRALVD